MMITKHGPDTQTAKQLDRMIPMKADTVVFEVESILNYQPDGEVKILREAMLDWGFPGQVVRVKRTITITTSEYEVVEELKSSSGAKLVVL